jgi:hypothetical protein
MKNNFWDRFNTILVGIITQSLKKVINNGKIGI